MRKSEKQYEIETGKKALYRKDSSDFHTLHYVDWLQTKVEALEEELKITAEDWEHQVKCKMKSFYREKQLQAELDKHRWIPVSEELPEEFDVVDVILEYTHPKNPMFKGSPRVEQKRECNIKWEEAKEYGGEYKRRWKITYYRYMTLPEQALKGDE